jgi:hypothetical protein
MVRSLRAFAVLSHDTCSREAAAAWMDHYAPISAVRWNATLVKLCANTGKSKLPLPKRSHRKQCHH